MTQYTNSFNSSEPHLFVNMHWAIARTIFIPTNKLCPQKNNSCKEKSSPSGSAPYGANTMYPSFLHFVPYILLMFTFRLIEESKPCVLFKVSKCSSRVKPDVNLYISSVLKNGIAELCREPTLLEGENLPLPDIKCCVCNLHQFQFNFNLQSFHSAITKNIEVYTIINIWEKLDTSHVFIITMRNRPHHISQNRTCFDRQKVCMFYCANCNILTGR